MLADYPQSPDGTYDSTNWVFTPDAGCARVKPCGTIMVYGKKEEVLR